MRKPDLSTFLYSLKRIMPKRFTLVLVLGAFAIICMVLFSQGTEETQDSFVTAIASVQESVDPTCSSTSAFPDASSFEIHFIDVGQADAALVVCDDQTMLIDGGNREDSDLIYSYLKEQDVAYLDYIVCTHGHEDHVGGIAGGLEYADIGTAFCSVTSYDSKAFENFVNALDQRGTTITVPSSGDSFSLGSSEVTIIGPIKEDEEEPNNMSIVLRIVYGDTSFLFTGDAEREEEQDILDAGYELKSTVLKVGHHGSDSSTSYPFLYEVDPEYGVISVGQDNSYGHPTEGTLSRLRDADVKVYRTDMQGTVICTSDGQNVTFATERNQDSDTLGDVGPNSLVGMLDDIL